jgi:hypothetical protein
VTVVCHWSELRGSGGETVENLRLTPDSECYLLDALLEALETWCHLYQNDIAPKDVVDRTSFAELDVTGYAPQAVSSWVLAVFRDGRAVSDADPVQFSRGSGMEARDVYGYFITQGRDGPLLWWQRVPGDPQPMRLPTDKVTVYPQLALRPIQE